MKYKFRKVNVLGERIYLKMHACIYAYTLVSARQHVNKCYIQMIAQEIK